MSEHYGYAYAVLNEYNQVDARSVARKVRPWEDLEPREQDGAKMLFIEIAVTDGPWRSFDPGLRYRARLGAAPSP